MRTGITGRGPASAIVDAKRAEQAGFDMFAVGEHVLYPQPSANSLVTLAVAAGATTRIRLLTSVLLLPLYPAVLAAKMAATLDVASHGRLLLGVGAGGEYRPEFEACGVDPADRYRRLDEGLLVLRQLFTEDNVNLEGQFTRLHDATLKPRPAQQPGIPIWVGGRRSASIRRTVRLGDVWMPYLISPEAIGRGAAEMTEQAEKAGRPPGELSIALFAWASVDADRTRAREQAIAAVGKTYNMDFRPLADKVLLAGTPDDVVSRIGEYAAHGVREIVFAIAGDDRQRDRTEECLVNEVLPRLREL